MRFITRITILLLACCAANSGIQAKGKDAKPVYAFAFGVCFNDSTVYLSAVSPLADGQLDPKTKFLNNRSAYSNRFKAFLDKKNNLSHTCTVFYSTKKEGLEKQLVKLRHRYQRSKEAKLVEVPASDFDFQGQ